MADTLQSPTDRKVQNRRTFIAALVGGLLARLVGAVPGIAAVFEWVDSLFVEIGYPGLRLLDLVTAAAAALVIVAYQRIAQAIGDRWPKAETVMLGSAARPHYEPATR